MKCSIHVFANDRFIHTSRSPLAWFLLACVYVSAIYICEDFCLTGLPPFRVDTYLVRTYKVCMYIGICKCTMQSTLARHYLPAT